MSARLPGARKFAPKRPGGAIAKGGIKPATSQPKAPNFSLPTATQATVPGPSQAGPDTNGTPKSFGDETIAGQQAPSGTEPSSQPESSQLPSATLVNPGTQLSQLPPTLSGLSNSQPSQSATQVDGSDSAKRKESSSPIATTKVAPTFVHPGTAVPPRPRAGPSASPAPRDIRRSVTPANTRPPPSIRTGGKPSLIAAAHNKDGALELPSYRGSRAGSRASSRAPSQSPIPGTPSTSMPPPLSTSIHPQIKAPNFSLPPAIQSGPSTSSYGLPPSLGTGLPPTLRAASPQIDPTLRDITPTQDVAPTPAPPPAQTDEEMATLAQSLVDGIHNMEKRRAPVVTAKAIKRKPPSKSPQQASEQEEGQYEAYNMEQIGEIEPAGQEKTAEASSSKGPRRPATRVTTTASPNSLGVRKPGKRKRVVESEVPEEEDVETEEAGGEEGDLDDEIQSTQGSTATAKARARKRAFKPKKSNRNVLFSKPEFSEANPHEMIGFEVNDEVDTLKDIVTYKGNEGRISARAIDLDRFLREKEAKRKAESLKYYEELWKKRQVLRRKHRANRNEEREMKRQAAIERGDDPMGTVSMDEGDSEEEYEVDPERLTPESTPEPGDNPVEEEEVEVEVEYDPDGNEIIREPAGEEGEDQEGEGEEEEEPFDPDRPPIVEPLFLPGPGEDGAESIIGGQENAEEDAGEDDDDAAWRAYGFRVRDNDAEGGDEEQSELGAYDDDEYLTANERYDRERRREFQAAQEREVVEEDPEKMINNMSYQKKRTKNEKWSAEETEFFYHVLGEVGENYGLMTHYFPGRSITQVKKKGVRENKVNPDKVTAAILARKRIDKSYLTKTVGYDTTRPMDREREFIAEAKADQERMKKEDSEILSQRVSGSQGGVGGGENGQAREGEGAEQGEGQREDGEEGDQEMEGDDKGDDEEDVGDDLEGEEEGEEYDDHYEGDGDLTIMTDVDVEA